MLRATPTIRSRFTKAGMLVVLASLAASSACSDEPNRDEDGDDGAGDGGSLVRGGNAGVSGSRGGRGGSSSGGAAPVGGDAGTSAGGSRGGSFPTGGSSTGGATPTGGTPPTGGALPTGGATPTGGASPTGGTGGTPATGGAQPTGGNAGGPPTGGTGGRGGAGGGAGMAGSGGGGTVTCDTTFTVGADGFVRAPALSGCWYGYAYAGGDTGSLVMPTSFATCGAGCTLRTSGSLGPATAANMYSGAVYIGFNLRQAAGSATFTTVIPTGTSLVVAYTKAAGPTTVRAQIQAGASRWCVNLTASPMTIPYTMFNTACWDNSGTAYAKQPIDAFQLVVPGGETAQPIDLAIVSVREQ